MSADPKILKFGPQSARALFLEVAEPDLKDFLETRTSRSAFHLVHSLWSVWEWHIRETTGQKPRGEHRSGDFRVLYDLAIGAKHLVVDDPARAIRQVIPPVHSFAGYGVAGGYGIPTTAWGSSGPLIELDAGSIVTFACFVSNIAEQIRREID